MTKTIISDLKKKKNNTDEHEPMGIPDFSEGGIVSADFRHNLDHLAISGINNLINEPQPVIPTTLENFIRIELNNLIEAVYRPTPVFISGGLVETTSKENIKLDKDYPHTCFNPKCKMRIHFHDFLNTNKNMNKNHLEKLWKSKYVQFFCCRCYKDKEKILEKKTYNHLERIIDRKVGRGWYNEI